jgi:glycosyltransferase involved in cell wall biosynthesis
MKKIAFLDSSYAHTKNKKYSGVGYYRMIQPARFLKDNFEITVFNQNLQELGENNEKMFSKLFEDYDMVVTKAVDNPHACSALGFFSDYYKKPLIIDLDDNYFTVRPDQAGYKYYYPGSQKWAILSAYFSVASGFVFSTKPLLDFHRTYIKNVYDKEPPMFVCPNFNDLNEFKYKPAKKCKNKIIIGWQGSTTHFSDIKMCIQAIANVMKQEKNVYFEILGALETEQAKDLLKDVNADESVMSRISVAGGTQSWEDYPELLSKQKWNIGIAPLINDEFNRNKSHIKWLEYAAYKIPCIASKVYPYYKEINGVKTIRHGKTGYLAKTVKDWEKYLLLLIKNDKLRKEIADNAYEAIKNDWQYDKHIQTWIDAFNHFLK